MHHLRLVMTLFSLKNPVFWQKTRLFGLRRRVAALELADMSASRKARTCPRTPNHDLASLSMRPISYDVPDPEAHWDNPNLRWGEPAYLLEPRALDLAIAPRKPQA